MVTLGFIVPIMVVLSVCTGVGVYVKIKRPSALVFACITNKLCPVFYEQIVGDLERIENCENPAGLRLRRAVLWNEFRLNWLYLCQEANNTILFLRALRFERLRISPLKWGLKYNDEEVLVLQLIAEAMELRWKQVRCQLVFLVRFLVGRRLQEGMLKALLDQYKELEEHVDHLAGIVDEALQKKLREALGLNNWGIVDGGNHGA